MKYALNFNNWLLENIEYHKELNPNFWNNGKLKPEIRKKLLMIAKDFWKSLKLDVKIIDIQLTGSISNYNWTDSSDLDVHIIIDFSDINENKDLVKKALDGQRFIWNLRHNVKINNHDVECYIQDKNEKHFSSGIFSLIKNKWIIEPKWNPPKDYSKEIDKKVKEFKLKLKDIDKKLETSKGTKAKILYNELKELKNKIRLDRQKGLLNDGEFSIENLTFKQLRKDGTIKQLIDIMSKAYKKIYENKKIDN